MTDIQWPFFNRKKILIFNQLQNKKSFHGYPIFKVVLGGGF